MCHDMSGGTHQILSRKLDDAMTRREPCTIERSQIPYRSPGMGPKTNILNHLEQKNLSGLPLLSTKNSPKYWPEALKGQSDRKE